MGLPQDLDDIVNLTIRINDFLSGLFLGAGIRLVEFKLEFGRLWENDYMRIVLADEISPDTCRLWDTTPTRSWTRTVSAATWAAWSKPIRKWPGAWGLCLNSIQGENKGPVLEEGREGGRVK